MARLNVYIPDDLLRTVRENREALNLCRIVREALERHLAGLGLRMADVGARPARLPPEFEAAAATRDKLMRLAAAPPPPEPAAAQELRQLRDEVRQLREMVARLLPQSER